MSWFGHVLRRDDNKRIYIYIYIYIKRFGGWGSEIVEGLNTLYSNAYINIYSIFLLKLLSGHPTYSYAVFKFYSKLLTSMGKNWANVLGSVSTKYHEDFGWR